MWGYFKINKEFVRFVFVSRPTTWLIFFIFFIVTSFYFHIDITILSLVQAFSFTLPLNFFGSYLNNKYDLRSDSLNISKSKKYSKGEVFREDDKRMTKYLYIFSILILLISSLTFNIQNFFFTFLLLFSIYAYSAPPFRLKEIPFVSSFICFLIPFCIVAVAYSYKYSVFTLPSKVSYTLLLAVPIHVLTTIADYSPDRGSGLVTISTFFGKRFSSLFMLSFTLFILLYSGIKNPFILSINFYLLIFGLILLVSSSEKIAKFGWKTFLLLFFISSILLLFSYLN